MLKKLLDKLEDPNRPLLGPNVKFLKFWGLLLPKNRFMRNFYMLMHILVTIFTATEYVDVFFILSDINLVLNNAKITLLATMSVCKVTTFLMWQQKWKDIIEYVTRTDLEQRDTSNKIKLDIINKTTKYCRKITFFYCSLMYMTVVIVMFHPIFKYFSSPSYRENVKKGDDIYLQVVSSWVPFDKNTIPGYLAASIYQSYAAIYGGGWITSFDTNSMVTMMFFKTELDLLRIDSADIFGSEKNPVSDEEALSRLKKCHKRHTELVKHASLFDSCLSPIMLLYMFVCSVMLCVTAYQITIQTSPMEKFLTSEYLVFGVSQLFIYCWHSNIVLNSSLDLTMGSYESTWWKQNVKNRRNLHILTSQFRKEIVFSAGPFSYLTVPTFINILKGAYSYYTILSQSQMD